MAGAPRERHSVAATPLRLAAVLLAGCTAVQPIPPAGSDFRFATTARAGAPTACDSGVASEAECLQPAVPLDGYFGGVAPAIWHADLERRRFARLGAEKTNQASLFNAMLWPLGGYLAVRSLEEDPSAGLLRKAGAFSLAVFGLLGSGIPDRDKLYLETSRRLACAIALASPYLYPKADIGTPDAAAYPASLRTLPVDEPDLLSTQAGLRLALADFRREQVAVRAQLKAVRPPAAEAPTAVERREQQRRGGGRSGGSAFDTAAAFGASVDRRLRDAEAAQQQVDAINDDISGAADRLYQRDVATRQRLDQALVARAPALVEPGVTATQVLAALGRFSAAFAPAGAASSATAKAQGGEQPWVLDEKALAAVDKPSRALLIAFETGPALRLQAAVDQARRWSARHQRRVQAANQAAADNGCSAALFASAGAFELPASAPPASSPSP